MALKVVNQGENILLDAAKAELVTLKLFKNNWTPADGDDESAATEADFSGCADHTLAWSSATTNGSGQAEISDSAVTWTKSGATGNTIYGAYVVDGSGALIYAERFASSVSMSNDGDQLSYTPIFTLYSQN